MKSAAISLGVFGGRSGKGAEIGTQGRSNSGWEGLCFLLLTHWRRLGPVNEEMDMAVPIGAAGVPPARQEQSIQGPLARFGSNRCCIWASRRNSEGYVPNVVYDPAGLLWTHNT